MAIAFVSGAFSTGSTTAGSSKTISYVPAANNTLVVFGFAPGTASVTNVTDTAGNTYYPRQIGTTASCWSTNAGASKTTAGNVITVTFSGSIRNTACVVEYSGVTGIGQAAAQVTGSSTAPSISLTTQNNNNLFVAGMGDTGTATWTLTTGTALRINQAGAGATTPGGAVIDNTSATPASVTCTGHLSASNAWGAIGVELTTVQASGDLDDAWANPTAPVPATNQVPNPWQFEQNEAPPPPPVPTYSRAITIDHTKVGGSDLTDYVALVKGTYSYLATVANGGLVQNASGFDVLFYSDSALTSTLNWEVESYDPTTGTVVYWVRLPSVSHTVDTTFYIAYGSSSITTDHSNTVQTWAGSGAPEPVYHLNNASFTDSNNGTKNAVGQNSPTSGTGQIGTGAVFNGSNQNAYVSPVQSPGGTLFPTSAGSPGSVSLWISLSSYGTEVPFYQDGVGHNDFQLTIPTTSSGTFGLELGSNPGVVRPTLKSDFLLSTLYKLDLTWNASNLIALYVNGVLDNSFVASDSTSGSAGWSTTIGSFAFGGAPTTGSFFAGLLDELRVYQQANSADFITCSYNNESSPSTFYSIGSQRPGQGVEDDSWWSSVMQSGATFALATAISVAAMTGVATTVAPWQDELPQTSSITLVDEDRAPYLPPPIPATLQYPQQWTFDTPEDVTHIDEDYWAIPPPAAATNLWPQQAAFDEQIPAGSLFGQPDEDYWANPTAPVAATLQYPPQWGFDEQIPAGVLFGIPDELYWQNLVPPVAASLQFPQQSSFADESVAAPPPQFDEDFWTNPAAIPQGAPIYPQQFQFDTQDELGHIDEDFWINPVAPVNPTYASPPQWTFDDQVPAGTLSGQPDEDYWQNSAPPVPATLLYPQQAQFDEQIPAGALSGLPEEDFWQNAVSPIPATLLWPQQASFDEQIPAGSLRGQPDEDYWQNPSAPVPASLIGPQQWTFDVQEPAGSLYGVPTDEYWQNPTVPVAASLVSPQPYSFVDEIPAYGQPDEDFWINPASPVPATLRYPQQAEFDEQIPAGSLYGVPNEEYWQNPVAPVAASLRYPQQTDFAEELTIVTLQIVDEDYWANPTAPVAAALTYPQQASFDEQIPAGNLRGQPDEDLWQNPARPVVAALQWPQPWIFDEQIPAGSLFGVPDESHWQNPAVPIQASLAPLQQFQFDAGEAFGFGTDEPWLNPAPASPWGGYCPQQFQFDEALPTTFAFFVEDEYWQNRVAPIPAALVYPQQAQFDDQAVPATAGTIAVEEYWINPVAPGVAALLYPQPAQFDEQIPAGALYGVPAEDYWQIPVPVAVAQLRCPQQADFDDQVIIGPIGIDDDGLSPGVPRYNPGYYPQPWIFAQDDRALPLPLPIDEIYVVIPRPVPSYAYRYPQQGGFEMDDVPVRVVADYVISNGLTVLDEVNGSAVITDLVTSLETTVTDKVSGGAVVSDLLLCNNIVVEDLTDSPEPVILE